jgi:hypothetical protein
MHRAEKAGLRHVRSCRRKFWAFAVFDVFADRARQFGSFFGAHVFGRSARNLLFILSVHLVADGKAAVKARLMLARGLFTVADASKKL